MTTRNGAKNTGGKAGGRTPRGARKGGFDDGFDPFANPTAPRSTAAENLPEPEPSEPPPPSPAVPAARQEERAVAKPVPVGIQGLAAQIPAPSGAVAGTTLTADQARRLDLCEAPLRLAEGTFVLMGRALETIREDRLYADSHTSFDLYCLDRWGLTRRRVDQLIQGWRLGLYLDSLNPGGANERQVRAMLPFAELHGQTVAGVVYETILKHARPSGELIGQVVRALPEHFDGPQALIEAVLGALGAGGPQVLAPPDDEPPARRDVFAAGLQSLTRIAPKVLTAAATDPDGARDFVEKIRKLADHVERSVQAGD